MFDSLKSKAAKSKGRSTPKSKLEIPVTTEFVQALKNNNLRISYAALADASETLGEHTATGMSSGQRGAKLVLGLPQELQPHVCRGNGSYQKGQEWDVDADVKTLRKIDYVRPERVDEFVQAFIASKEEAETPADEPEATEVPASNGEEQGLGDDSTESTD